MVEGAGVTPLALSVLLEDLAFLGPVVGVDSTKSSLSEVLWEWLNNNKILCQKDLGVNLRHLVVSTQLVRERIGRTSRVGTFLRP